MITAGEGTSAMAKQRFRDFQFAFATTLVHEAGPHVMLTCLGHGRLDTPEQLAVTGYTSTEFPGESGRSFEMSVFGGTTEYYRDTRQDDRQVSPMHILISQY